MISCELTQIMLNAGPPAMTASFVVRMGCGWVSGQPTKYAVEDDHHGQIETKAGHHHDQRRAEHSHHGNWPKAVRVDEGTGEGAAHEVATDLYAAHQHHLGAAHIELGTDEGQQNANGEDDAIDNELSQEAEQQHQPAIASVWRYCHVDL